MLLTIVLTILGTSALYALLAVLLCRRVANHLRGNSFAANMLVEHVILPVLGKPTPRPAEPASGEPIPVIVNHEPLPDLSDR